MRRAAAGPFLAAAVLAGSLAACTSGTGGEGSESDAAGSGDTGSAAPAPPGRYSTLPEPCGAVARSTLKRLVPGSENHEGEAVLTYDTDRRVGCKWSGRTATAGRYLTVDFERVVSYDDAVSDDEQARQDFADLAAAAHISTEGSSASVDGAAGQVGEDETPSEAADGTVDRGGNRDDGRTPESASDDARAQGRNATATATPSASAPSASDPSTADPSAVDLAPRLLDGIGDAAFIDDELVTQDSGTHRDVTLVFRTSNVLVTVEYAQWPQDKAVIPPSGPLQQKARDVAAELVERFEE